MTASRLSLDFATLIGAYRSGALRPGAVVDEVLRRIAAAGSDAVWIARTPEAGLRARAAELERRLEADPALLERLPLYGIPFGVKDNIDAPPLATTAACPEFAYTPGAPAAVVQRLADAGAILVGKTNLDQFATGLAGVRSPYGVARNPFDPAYLPGGSSSGSAVAVSAGLVSFALGTDTAGSGRVPAGFTNTVGLKPTRGLIPAHGVVPACRSLDCVSVFALTVPDAWRVLRVAAGPDPRDAFSRAPAGVRRRLPPRFRFGVPGPEHLEFCGDAGAAAAFASGVERLVRLGGEPEPVDCAPLLEAGALLYSGPWVAERLAALQPFMERHAAAVHPLTRQIIEGGARFSAADAFRASYRLEALRRTAERLLHPLDILAVPTAPTIYRVDEVLADPLRLNSNLGRYTQFVNLLDLAALAVPNGFLPNGLPVGLTLIGPAFSDEALARLGWAFQQEAALPLGATGAALPLGATGATLPALPFPEDGGLAAAPGASRTPLVVVGAHMSGLALNPQLRGLGGRFEQATSTAPVYRLYALRGDPPRPGLVRVASGGVSIACEVWSLDAAGLGNLLATVPAPLAIGTVQLADGSAVKGFVFEAAGAAGVPDISALGGWRAYVARG